MTVGPTLFKPQIIILWLSRPPRFSLHPFGIRCPLLLLGDLSVWDGGLIGAPAGAPYLPRPPSHVPPAPPIPPLLSCWAPAAGIAGAPGPGIAAAPIAREIFPP
ncbi:hypothetical protein TNIN_152001 [Trichonephila inaurata madagascariensis]|uniref:Uncharacterized protein n=1 Tax=Trichonephila inaurata madagascariensis TaxID=2747483 RepID=A0A8X7BQY4_9ARAC|nr:hypothetical protein TNIN_152001 [Trichonephila inaurata madagascariensis]